MVRSLGGGGDSADAEAGGVAGEDSVRWGGGIWRPNTLRFSSISSGTASITKSTLAASPRSVVREIETLARSAASGSRFAASEAFVDILVDGTDGCVE